MCNASGQSGFSEGFWVPRTWACSGLCSYARKRMCPRLIPLNGAMSFSESLFHWLTINRESLLLEKPTYLTSQYIGGFGEWSGEGVFAKTPSPDILLPSSLASPATPVGRGRVHGGRRMGSVRPSRRSRSSQGMVRFLLLFRRGRLFRNSFWTFLWRRFLHR